MLSGSAVDVVRIQKYKPVCLLNVNFKIFTKVLNNRLLKVVDKLIGPSQTAFILVHYTTERVVTLHETILCYTEKNAIILKLDSEKAYYKLKWSFVQQVLQMNRFSPTWCEWIRKLFLKGSVVVQVINNIGHYF